MFINQGGADAQGDHHQQVLCLTKVKTWSVVKTSLPIYYGKLLIFFSSFRQTLQTTIKIGCNRTHAKTNRASTLNTKEPLALMT